MPKIFLLTFLFGLPTWACSCGAYPSAKDAWLDSPLVFSGFVEKTDPKATSPEAMAGYQSAWVRVTEPFKGVKHDQVFELRDQFSSCFGGFQEGAALLFYLREGKQLGTWVAPACHRTQAINDAVDDLKFLRGLPASARGNRVSGRVQAYEDDAVKGFHWVRDYDGVRVQAVGASSSSETVTDAQGHYEFRNLPPGAYTIKIDYPQGTKLRFPIAYGRLDPRRRATRFMGTDTQLEVDEESGNGFDFLLSPDNRITGRVLGPGGRPMKDVCVEIQSLQADSARFSRIFGCTKADGGYVLAQMSAGSYRVVANARGGMTAAAPFGKLYYPGTLETDQAGVVTIAAGQHLEGIDIHVPELARRIELRGRLSFSNGVPVANQSIRFRGNDDRYDERGKTDANGNFVTEILAGKPGTLTGEIMLWREQEGACPQFNAKFHPNGLAASLNTTQYSVAGDESLSRIELTFPFPSCDAWLKIQAAERKQF